MADDRSPDRPVARPTDRLDAIDRRTSSRLEVKRSPVRPDTPARDPLPEHSSTAF
ncbi:hypothetical protein ATKI12_8935 [Kitasatospora sp. Ki12]